MNDRTDLTVREDEARAEAFARAAAQGVDLSSLRARLAMTPTERLAHHQQALARVEAVRRARRV